MKTATLVNGVKVVELEQIIEEFKKDAGKAKLKARAHNQWVNGGHCRSRIKDFNVGGEEDATRSGAFTLEADEPEPMLGENHGPTATEAALHALASCLNTTFIYHAAAKGIEIKELELELEGDLDLRGFLGVDPKVRNGYTTIHVTFRVKSDAPREKIEELMKLAQRRSPVFDIVTHETPVEASLELL